MSVRFKIELGLRATHALCGQGKAKSGRPEIKPQIVVTYNLQSRG